MELLDAINGRMSVREYTEEPVNDAVLRELIEAAIEAPSAINQQPWAFIVVKDRECLTRISDRAKTHLLKASLAAPAHRFREMLNDPKFDIFYHAPVLIVIAASEPTDWVRTRSPSRPIGRVLDPFSQTMRMHDAGVLFNGTRLYRRCADG